MRLFTSRRQASMALSAWLKGVWEPIYESSDWDGRNVRIGAEPPDKAPDNRPAEDFEIVTFNAVEEERPQTTEAKT